MDSQREVASKQNVDTKNVVELTNGGSDDGQEKRNEDAPENNPQYTTVYVGNLAPEELNELGTEETRTEADPIETFKHVCCLVCSTDEGVIDEDEVYHFFNVIPSEA